MKRRLIFVVGAVALAAAACSNLGLGEADCTPPERGVSGANILAVQAVPSARYTPCLNELRLGWDGVSWFAHNGRAGFEIFKSTSPFLTAAVTPSCDVTGATQVASGHPDIERFERVEFQEVAIRLVIVPSGERPLLEARRLESQYAGVELEDRPLEITVADDLAVAVSTRVNQGLGAGAYVWIIDELDAEERTVEMRSADPVATGSGLSPGGALDLIEDRVPDLYYRGAWYFTFDGGCITYDFDAEGPVAESVAADADDALGFYPAYRLRQFAEESGYDVGD